MFSLGYWQLACQFSREGRIPLVVILILTLTFVFFGNILIVWSVYKFPHMRRTAYILIANLTISNNVHGLYFLVTIIASFSQLTQEERRYICMSRYGLILVTLLGSEYNMLLISIERFIAVHFPFRHKCIINRTRLKIVLICVWIFYIVFASLPLFGWNEIVYYEGKLCTIRDTWTTSYLSIVCALVLIGLVLNLVLFAKVLYKIKCKRLHGLAVQVRHHRKTTWISFGILFGFVICWGPFFFGTLMAAWGYLKSDIPCAQISVTVIAAVNGLVNWLIYGLCNRKFREAFRAILTCKTLERQTLYRISNNSEQGQNSSKC